MSAMSAMSASLSTASATNEGLCRLCFGLIPNEYRAHVHQARPLKELSEPACKFCKILKESIHKIDANFLQDLCNVDQDAPVSVKVFVDPNPNRRITIDIVPDQGGRGMQTLSVEMFVGAANITSDLPFAGPINDISTYAGSDSTWEFLQSCYNKCMQSHPICAALQDTGWLPNRLLLLFNTPLGEACVIRLVESSSHKPTSSYIALSHCWGKSAPLCTTRHNITSHYDGIEFERLPRTFQDCVSVAQRMQIRYLWIDSLCIIQDVPSDWAYTAMSMDRIYENAAFTVAAVSSPGSSTPFLGHEANSDREDSPSYDIDVSTISDTVKTVKARQYTFRVKPDYISGPLETRAWAWQERCLSLRTINFTPEEVRWSCATVRTCECLGVENAEPLNSKQRTSKTAREWRSMVTDYSKRDLTYWTDRLPALSGMASRFSTSIRSEYLAGIWASDFPRCIAWYKPFELTPAIITPMKSSLDNRYPSWSWASVSGGVQFIWDNHKAVPPAYLYSALMLAGDPEIKSCVNLLGHHCIPRNPENPFGEVEAGSYLEIRGRVIEAELESSIYGYAHVRREGFRPQFFVPDCHIINDESTGARIGGETSGPNVKARTHVRRAVPSDRSEEDPKYEECKGSVICLLLFTKNHLQNKAVRPCMLVLGVSVPNDAQPVYQRLGIAAGSTWCNGPVDDAWNSLTMKPLNWEEPEQWENWEEWFNGAKEQVVRII